MRAAWSGSPVDVDGRHYRVEGATTREVPDPIPPIYFGGASKRRREGRCRRRRRLPGVGRTAGHGERTHRSAHCARHCCWSHAAIRHPIPRHRPTDLRGGVGVSPIACSSASRPRRAPRPRSRLRDDPSPKGNDARPSWRRAPPRCIRSSGDPPQRVGRASAWSAAASAPRSSDRTRRSPTASSSTTISASTTFILSGYPHLEEAYWFGEGVMPILRRSGHVPALDSVRCARLLVPVTSDARHGPNRIAPHGRSARARGPRSRRLPRALPTSVPRSTGRARRRRRPSRGRSRRRRSRLRRLVDGRQPALGVRRPRPGSAPARRSCAPRSPRSVRSSASASATS